MLALCLLRLFDFRLPHPTAGLYGAEVSDRLQVGGVPCRRDEPFPAKERQDHTTGAGVRETERSAGGNHGQRRGEGCNAVEV